MKNGNESVVIVSATRTAVGSFCGGLASIPAHDLGAVLIKKVAESANIDLSEIDEVILGQILTAGQGQNPARQAAMKAGVPEEKTAFLVNQLCGSGLRAVALGAQQLILGDANIIIAGGQESMSQSHHSAFLRLGKKMGSMHIEDTMLKDGLNDALFGYHMGVTAENISKKFKISRKKQDAFALNSQLKASKSQLNGKFIDEITPINIQSKKENKIFKNDEYIRTNINLQAIEKLQPAFDDLGTVTAANSSGL
ncbi:MAG: acetyl-CoA C-acetyltransferase, partial [Amylibacter sp.]|nr:acetyl-CoA C-acetyltransferase [Amylibacter sp.]